MLAVQPTVTAGVADAISATISADAIVTSTSLAQAVSNIDNRSPHRRLCDSVGLDDVVIFEQPGNGPLLGTCPREHRRPLTKGAELGDRVADSPALSRSLGRSAEQVASAWIGNHDSDSRMS